MLQALQRGPVEALDLARLIWNDAGPEWCDSNLRQNVWRLNRVLRPEGWEVRSNRRWWARGTYELVRINRRGKRMGSEEVFLVWSNEHRGWWRPQRRGYTRDLAEAGRYSRAQAIEICRGAIHQAAHIGLVSELPVRFVDVLAFLQGAKVPKEISSDLGENS